MERLFCKTTPCAAFLLAALHFFALAASASSPLSVTAFSRWELAHDGAGCALAASALNNHAVLFRLVESYAAPRKGAAQPFRMSIELSDEELGRFDGPEPEECAVFADGREYAARAEKRGSVIEIAGTGIVEALLGSTHENFVVSFPELAISWTFPLSGLKQAVDRARILRESFEIASRSEKGKAFGLAGSVAIMAFALLAFAFFVWKSLRRRGQAASAPGAGSGAKEEGAQAAAQGAKRRGAYRIWKERRAEKEEERRAQANRAYARQAGAGGANFDDDFYRRANFANPFARGSSLPDDVRAALQLFGLPENASFREMRKKRNFMLKACHPDRFENDAAARAEAEEETKRINAAFEILEKHFKR